jgi:ABC-type transport system involved in cytochrome c biogenesis permease component
VKVLLRQIRWEQRQFFRNVPAAVFTVAFPLIFLVLLSALFEDERVESVPGNPKFVQLFVPAIVAYGVISACYTGLAFTLTVRREDGILKRKRGTPLRLRDYIGGMIGSSLVVSALLSAVTIAIGILAFGVTFPHWAQRIPALLVVLLIGATCASTWGSPSRRSSRTRRPRPRSSTCCSSRCCSSRAPSPGSSRTRSSITSRRSSRCGTSTGRWSGCSASRRPEVPGGRATSSRSSRGPQ